VRDLTGRYLQTRNGGFSSVYLRTPGIPHLASALWAIATQFTSRVVAVSLAVCAVSVWGIVEDVRRRDAATATAAAYAACLVLSVALPNRAFLYRNYLVVVPVVCVGFGGGVVALVTKVRALLAGRRALRAVTLGAIGLAAAWALVALPVSDAIAAQRDAKDPRVRALDWVAQRSPGDVPVDVAITSSVFGKRVVAGYPGLGDILQNPRVHVVQDDLEACPDPSSGALYVVDASYRDTAAAPGSDPWQELWLFRECPGYDAVARFDASPFEINVSAYPTWPGRVSAIVLRRAALSPGEPRPRIVVDGASDHSAP
jgi:hypothetical protein